VRAASKAYEAVADAFAQLNDLPKLKAQINAGRDTWADVRPQPFKHISV
jgi:COP9 signalosome complex subunit 3